MDKKERDKNVYCQSVFREVFIKKKSYQPNQEVFMKKNIFGYIVGCRFSVSPHIWMLSSFVPHFLVQNCQAQNEKWLKFNSDIYNILL